MRGQAFPRGSKRISLFALASGARAGGPCHYTASAVCEVIVAGEVNGEGKVVCGHRAASLARLARGAK
jgi:hypothetical protein